jgi:hypothetical protein
MVTRHIEPTTVIEHTERYFRPKVIELPIERHSVLGIGLAGAGHIIQIIPFISIIFYK